LDIRSGSGEMFGNERVVEINKHDGCAYKIVLTDPDSDYIQKNLAFEQIPYELPMLMDIRSRVGEGDLVLDIGANIGNHTIYLATVAGCRVVAFEPNENLTQAIQKSAEQNNVASRVTIKSHALGESRGIGHFERNIPENIGAQSIVVGDGILKIYPLDEIDLPGMVKVIKIDVEGMEMSVLKGAVLTIQNNRPYLYVECQFESDFISVTEFLSKVGYCYFNTFNATPTHLYIPVEKISEPERNLIISAKVSDLVYKKSAELTGLRQKVNEVSLKYRSACEQIDFYKKRIGQDSEVQTELNKKISSTLEELSEVKFEVSRLLSEIDSLNFELHSSKINFTKEVTDVRGELLEKAILIDQLEAKVAKQLALNCELEAEKEAFESNLNQEIVFRQQLAGQLEQVKNHSIEQQSASDLHGALEKDRYLRKILAIHRQKDDLFCVATEDAIQLRRLGYLNAIDKARAESEGNTFLDHLGLVFLSATRKKELAQKRQEWQRLVGRQALFGGDRDPLILLDCAAKYLGDIKDNSLSFLQLKVLRVAAIMDEFTHESYRHECNLLQLTPQHWQTELSKFKPELLFIESAWRGKQDQWGSKVGHKSAELRGIVAWCRANGIPTVFWNKEDPVHFETFLSTAKLFDFIFTTDIDCIHRYKAALEHERVYLLPFAAQPAVNNPIETYRRKDAFCFAGAYYVRYPDRTRDLDDFIASLPEYRPFEIYDRNFGKDDTNYKFPEQYQPYIVGNLPFSQIDRAYKGYNYAINLNSIKNSQSMFARRVFELLASNTLTISNFSRGLRLMFGDLVFAADSGAETLERLQRIEHGGNRLQRLRLMGLRKTLSEHTYKHRFAYLVSKVLGETTELHQPKVLMTAYARDQKQLSLILGHFERQAYSRRCLLVAIRDGFVPAEISKDERIVYVPAHELNDKVLANQVGNRFDWVAALVPEDYYGEHYLTDLVLATDYSDADMIGKYSHYLWSDSDGLALLHSEYAYRHVNKLPARAALVRASAVGEQVDSFPAWFTGIYRLELKGLVGLAIDPFNYCRNKTAAPIAVEAISEVADLADLDTGIPFAELVHRAEEILPEQQPEVNTPTMSGTALAKLFRFDRAKHFKTKIEHGVLEISSQLEDGKHEYLYATQDLSPEDLCFSKGMAQFYFDHTPGLNVQLVLLFLNGDKERISHAMLHGNRNLQVELPEPCTSIRLGIRVYAGGYAGIRGLALGYRTLNPPVVFGRSPYMLLTNHYPSYDNLYRNGFVHSRIQAYRERGVNVDLFRLRPQQDAPTYHEFKGVDVITASKNVLRQMLASGQYKKVLVHFLDSSMWEVLNEFIDTIKVVVWIHGAEIHPWHRRKYNIENEQQEMLAKEQSAVRMAFWQSIFSPVPENLNLVFVSRYFASEVMEDFELSLPVDKYRIIHNPINTQTFNYIEKQPEQRLKILLIRPFSSRQYANDVAVNVILELSKKEFFSSLEIRIIGDGRFFEETLAPLRSFSNVSIENRFLNHAQISELHKSYGIFLCPTRWDSHGVSRDEAMASGLVPATNAIAAIPEFVDDSCAVLAPAEDAVKLAEGISSLIENPHKFSLMSANAAARIRRQTAEDLVIAQEILAIEN